MGRFPRWSRVAAYLVFALLCIAVACYAGLAATARPRAYDSQFYFGLRSLVSIWAALAAMVFAWQIRHLYAWIIYVGIAVLFNPLRPFYLSKGAWSVIDLAVLLVALWTLSIAWKGVQGQGVDVPRLGP